MITFLYGKDIYRLRKEIKRIIDEYKHNNPDWFDYIRIDCGDSNIETFEEIRKSTDIVPMFNSKKLIIIENIFMANQEIQEKILEFLKKRDLEKNKNIEIIFWTEETDKNSSLFKFLKSKAKEFNLLEGNQLKNWIIDYVQEQKGDIDNQAIDKLIEYVGNDLWRMENEINKLISFKFQASSNKLQTIKAEDIEALVKPEIDLNIFKMIDALGHKNKNKALSLLKKHLEKGESEGYLLDRFIYQFRNLIRVKSDGRLDLHPFVIKKTKEQARNFDFEQLKKIYSQLLTIDFEIKTGRIDSKTALELFITKL